ncbi:MULTISPECIES: hypothetical protein [Pontibacillus]|uniref:Uncharacterized protein n=1 Tax=Pontibacillus chungwhensis TaxID=265426 RepID=A0ABY8UW71_9BACI|nr:MULTISPECIES: hypothetical protein [Pontibacillus]MCD5324214.1 hypothetical protein [Pontibacillus sp. HN14]WIF97729.1 hypothetical protein QNI29_18690 [Pontibacillus chungwhensis]
MKWANGLKVVGVSVLVSGMLVFGSGPIIDSFNHKSEGNIVYADSYLEMGYEENVSPGKSWNVMFNVMMDTENLSDELIYIKDEEGNKIETQLFHTKYFKENHKLATLVRVGGVDDYELGETYTMYIEKDFKDEKGNRLKSGVKKTFKVEEEKEKGEIGEKALSMSKEEFLKDEEVKELNKPTLLWGYNVRTGEVGLEKTFDTMPMFYKEYVEIGFHKKLNGGYDEWLDEGFVSMYLVNEEVFVRDYPNVSYHPIVNGKLMTDLFKEKKNTLSVDPLKMGNYDNINGKNGDKIEDVLLMSPEKEGQMVVELNAGYKNAVLAYKGGAEPVNMGSVAEVKNGNLYADGSLFESFGLDVKGKVNVKKVAKENGLEFVYNEQTELYRVKNFK